MQEILNKPSQMPRNLVSDTHGKSRLVEERSDTNLVVEPTRREVFPEQRCARLGFLRMCQYDASQSFVTWYMI